MRTEKKKRREKMSVRWCIVSLHCRSKAVLLLFSLLLHHHDHIQVIAEQRGCITQRSLAT